MVRHKDELLKKRAKLAFEINYFIRTELGLESFYQMVGQSLFLFIAKTQTPTEVVTNTIRDVSGEGLIGILILSLMWSFARSILSNNRQRFVPSIGNIEMSGQTRGFLTVLQIFAIFLKYSTFEGAFLYFYGQN